MKSINLLEGETIDSSIFLVITHLNKKSGVTHCRIPIQLVWTPTHMPLQYYPDPTHYNALTLDSVKGHFVVTYNFITSSMKYEASKKEDWQSFSCA